MADENDGALKKASQTPVSVQLAGEGLGMMVNAVFGGTVCEGSHIRVVAVCQNAHPRSSQEVRKDVNWPKDVPILAGPGIFWVAVQTMNEDDTVFSFPYG